MSAPTDRLRAADPAAGLGPQPDERAEADLRILLADPQVVARPAVQPERRYRAPVLATAFVALAVIVLVAAVLGVVHPRTDTGGEPSTAPTLGTGCHPAQIRPFECGTYRSKYGDASVDGDAGGPAKDRISIAITREGGALVLEAVGRCLATRFPVALDASAGAPSGATGLRIKPADPVRFTANGCTTGVDTKHWAHAWLQRSHTMDSSGGLTFDLATNLVTFEFEGAAPIGQPQLSRNDRTCVAAHVAPFSCGTFIGIGGSGSLAFMAANPFRVSFQHYNGELVAGFSGRCNSISRVLEPDGSTVVASGGSISMMACGGNRGLRDSAVLDFFSGTLTYRIDGRLLTFTSGSSSVTFTRAVGACGSTGSVSPLCGISMVRAASTQATALKGYRFTFASVGSRATVAVPGLCGTSIFDVAIDQSNIRFEMRGLRDDHPCPSGANDRDVAMQTFLSRALRFSVTDGTLTLTSAGSDPNAFVELVPEG